MAVFWSKGFTATSTGDLVEAMQIGRQSMYDSFGDKRALYLEALAHYQQQSIAAHVERGACARIDGSRYPGQTAGRHSAASRHRRVGAFYRHRHAGPSDRRTRGRQAGSIAGDGTVLCGGADALLIPRGRTP